LVEAEDDERRDRREPDDAEGEGDAWAKASREMKGPRSTSLLVSYCSGSREAITAPRSGAPAAKAQTR